VLLASEGRSTRSIAAEVGVEPRIVSNWRRRFAEHGLAGLEDRSRASKKPIYGALTNKRILALLDKPPPQGYARWTGPLLAKALEDRRSVCLALPARAQDRSGGPQVVVREQRSCLCRESGRRCRPLCCAA
jgi:hypothetical protein